LLLGVALGYRRLAESRGPKRLPLVASALAVLTYGVVLAINLQAYGGGGHQVRAVQVSLVELSARQFKPWILAFDVPLDFRGCPTIDAYLRDLLAPPFTTKRIPALSIVSGSQREFGRRVFADESPGSYLEMRRRLGREHVLFAWCYGNPPSARSIFGIRPTVAREGSTRCFPPDGEILVIDRSGDGILPSTTERIHFPYDLDEESLSGLGKLITTVEASPSQLRETPLFSMPRMFFACPMNPECASGRLEISSPGRLMQFPFAVGGQGQVVGGNLVYWLGMGTSESANPGLPWPLPPEVTRDPLFLEWRMLQFDTDGALLHSSEPSRLIVLDGR
jgi:hypothetical protein